MELYKETINKVEFEAPNSTVNVTAEYVYNDGAVTPVVPARDAVETTIWTIDTPYLPDEGTFKVNWKFTLAGNQYTKTDTYSVVTPYVSTRWIKRNLLEDYTDEQIREAEASARFIINAHTGQDFGRIKATRTVYGAGGNSLALPGRLISIDTVNGVAFNDAAYHIGGEGWYLNYPGFGIPPLRADYHGVHEINGVIYNPYGVNFRAFLEGAKYEIVGTWGWETVPEAITEAAKLLINDYATNEGVYRDKYLLSMTAADWRIQFTAGAFQRTGNVRADQLLSGYVLQRGWAVI